MRNKFKSHDIQNIVFSGTTIHLTVDGDPCEIDLQKFSYRLGLATQVQLENFNLIDDGVGLYWPDLDEGIFVDILIGRINMLSHDMRESWASYVQKKLIY